MLDRNARRAFLALCGTAALGLAACMGDDGEGPSAPPRGVETTWMAPPHIQAVDADERGVSVFGAGSPGDRVVLTGTDDVSVAGSTGADGRFTVRLSHPSAPALYRIEIQRGRNEARSGAWLLLAPGAPVAAAVLQPGAAAVSLNRSGLLSSVDYDGMGLLAAGSTAPESPVRVTLDDGPSQSVVSGPDGRYVARFAAAPAGARRVLVQAGERSQAALLSLSEPSATLSVQSLTTGLRVDWPTDGAGAQSTWLFDAQTPTS